MLEEVDRHAYKMLTRGGVDGKPRLRQNDRAAGAGERFNGCRDFRAPKQTVPMLAIVPAGVT
jgi:hypothetical protein